MKNFLPKKIKDGGNGIETDWISVFAYIFITLLATLLGILIGLPFIL